MYVAITFLFSLFLFFKVSFVGKLKELVTNLCVFFGWFCFCSACFLVCGWIRSPRIAIRFMKLLRRSDLVFDFLNVLKILLIYFHFLVDGSVNQ